MGKRSLLSGESSSYSVSMVYSLGCVEPMSVVNISGWVGTTFCYSSTAFNWGSLLSYFSLIEPFFKEGTYLFPFDAWEALSCILLRSDFILDYSDEQNILLVFKLGYKKSSEPKFITSPTLELWLTSWTIFSTTSIYFELGQDDVRLMIWVSLACLD